MWRRFLAWFREINEAGKLMGAYTDDAIGSLQPGKGRSTSVAQRRAWTQAADWASREMERVGD